jgi:hypothetical protein
MKKPQRIVRKASFPRLSELREELGWEVIDILRKLTSDKPSIATIYRLDRGQAVRVASARKSLLSSTQLSETHWMPRRSW